MVRQAKVAEEHWVALACHDNLKEFFGYVNKHKPRAPLGPVLFVDQWWGDGQGIQQLL